MWVFESALQHQYQGQHQHQHQRQHQGPLQFLVAVALNLRSQPVRFTKTRMVEFSPGSVCTMRASGDFNGFLNGRLKTLAAILKQPASAHFGQGLPEPYSAPGIAELEEKIDSFKLESSA